jgi:hypothetical protein
MRIKAAPTAAQPYPRYAACANIRDFGAMGDGSSDDAVALQKAINAVGSGCSIFFPPGVYKLASNVTIGKDIILQLGPQVEIRQFARLMSDTNASRSLTVQGEGPGTSVWRQSIAYPFWSGITNGPRFRNLRLINMEFKPLSSAANVYQLGGSTDLFEMVAVTCSRGDGVGAQFLPFGLADSTSGMAASALLNVLRDVVVSNINMWLHVQDKDLQITRLAASLSSYALVEADRFSGSGQFSMSSCSLSVGYISAPLQDLIYLSLESSAKLSASINDLEIRTDGNFSAINARTIETAELNLLVNALRYTTTYPENTGYAVRTADSSTSIVRAVLTGCFFRTTNARTDACIQGTLVNSASLRTLAGVDQRGWASLT